MATTRLANADPAHDWSRRAWTDFDSLPAAAKARTLAILPVHGLADHGLGQPLDAEEIAGAEILRRAVMLAGRDVPLLVLPPLRWVLGPYPASLFGIDPETAHDLVREIAASVQAAGFGRLVFFNTSPWNVELIDAASRDARAGLGLQTFVIGLAGLGLDLHPASARRAHAQAVIAHLLGSAPETPTAPDAGTGHVSDAGFRPGCFRRPPAVAPAPSLDGAALLADAAAHLARLLAEVDARPPLDARGAAPTPAVRMATAAEAAALTPGTIWPDGWRARSLASFTPAALAALPDKDRAMVILPVGAIEQHGHHLPVGVDAILGQAWLEHALPHLPADAPVYVAPPITFGKSNEHVGFPGTVWISARTLRRLLLAAARQVAALGFRTLAILNTHGGNSAVLVYTLREIQTTPGLRAGMIGHNQYPLPLDEQERQYGFHAGQWETALMLAAAPDTVRLDRAVVEFPARLDDPGELRPENAPAIFSWITSDISQSGVMGDPTKATPADGRRWLDEAAAVLAQRILEVL